MPVYMISVTCAAAIGGIILSLIFYRLKLFNFRTTAAITLASLVTALVMPGVLILIFSSGNTGQDPSAQSILAIVSILVYLILVLILSAAIVYLLPKIKIGQKAEIAAEAGAVTEGALAETGALTEEGIAQAGAVTEEGIAQAGAVNEEAAASLSQNLDQAGTAETVPSPVQETDGAALEMEASSAGAVSAEPAMPGESMLQTEPAAETDTPLPSEDWANSLDENIMDGDLDMKPGDNYIEEIYLKFVGREDENSEVIANNVENEGFEENSDEISVDSNENIDKMGIENNIQDSDNMTIEECIDEAFRLREAGDPEGSILYFMYALDKKPQKELTFWIILDICVMYKSLGQQDLALDILDGYYDIYGDEMDSSVKEEIVRNLTDIGA
ncbi:MAG: hypothetical protein GX279_01485 [Clostridiaceae bacterium]|nr:hypothetical protein [Clostridiaceae bacterium]